MNQQPSPTRIAQRGLTLVELMIALTIGLFLLGAISALFLNTRSGFDYSNEVARIQETGRFALDTISRDIRMAGYNGCGRTVLTANLITGASTNPLLNFNTPILGYEQGALPSFLTSAGALAGTDAIVLIGASNGDMVVQSHAPPQINTNNHSIKAGEILFITDCSKASIFQMSGPAVATTTIEHNMGTVTPGNCATSLGLLNAAAVCPGGSAYTYKPGSLVMRLSSSAYFIGNSTLNNGTRSLYSMDLEGTTSGTPAIRELLVGVENMQIVYGLNSSATATTTGTGTVDSFATANAVTDWSKVVSVRISLLVRSTRTNLAVGNQPYTYMITAESSAETPVIPSDGILRRVFTETVVARNRTM